ncbi:hypothetical protein LPJ66_006054 [Kickxella alabastrina]|uniref:Uncharacterized protein n=1 Tax=Kickxella alabastrina TaxID=61397 RepID=A0ACC1ICN3_9FUNG|nr:hypothetical protein LPJ66_006054 [Kickxella alabastrina]
MHLGLSCHGASRTCAPIPRRAAPSLSIRTADGSCVSILNDCDETDDSSNASDHKRCSSVPGLSPGSSPTNASSFRALSTPGATTPLHIPSMLPSLSTLVQAVGLVTAASNLASDMHSRRSISGSIGIRNSGGVRGHRHTYYSGSIASSHDSFSLCASSPTASASLSEPASAKTTGKRKYRCAFNGCGKAFTTSGHLARHQRIHTGEKNFGCLYPGCSSRFSRQDNMMQHYRTHLSTKSRRNVSPRKAVFGDAATDAYHSHGMYAPQVFAGSHPIQHHAMHPYARPAPASATASGATADAAGPQQRPKPTMCSSARAASSMAASNHKVRYGLPTMHVLASPGAQPRSAPASHEYHAAMAKHSPAITHHGSMAFY